jgi:hypothetical protein
MNVTIGRIRFLGGAAALAAALMFVTPLSSTAGNRGWSDNGPTRSGVDFQWHGRIAPGKAIEIKGINGGIHVEPTTGSEVEVRARKTAHRSDPNEVEIEVIPHADGVTICALYPTPPGERPNECSPGETSHSHTRNNDVQVEYTVRVPAGVRFIGRTVNGEIDAHGLTADAEAYTVNGSVHVSTRGTAQANTVNGSIDVAMGRGLDESLEFATVNGGITLSLPSGASADVRASTTNGSIDSDFPISVRGRINRHHLSGTIGRGGPGLSLTTVNGNIRLRSSSL